MAGQTTATRNAMLSAVYSNSASAGVQAAYASVHTGDPGTTGANEASGGSYARQPVTWAAPSGGSVSGGTVNVPLPAGTYGYVGYWTALTAGTFVSGYAMNGTVTYASAQTLPITLSESQT